MIKRVLFSLFFVSVFSVVQAQRIGVSAGVSLSKTLFFVADTTVFTYNVPGIKFGALGEFRLANNLYQTIGVDFSQRGYKISDSGKDYKFKYNYINIPANICYRFELDNIMLTFEIGPYMGVGLNGKVIQEGKNKTLKFGTNEGEFRRFDVGLNVGYHIEFEKFILGTYYLVGFNNISNYSSETIKNRSFNFSIGYFIR